MAHGSPVWHCEGFVLAGVGICAGHMAYFETQAEREEWFKGKQVSEFNEYSFIRPDEKSKNAYAPGCCHPSLKYNESTEVDYVMFKNKDMGERWFYAQVVNREYVNPTSTRLWFEVDWYSTFADLLTVGMCYIERTHVPLSEDIDGDGSRGYSNTPEPISANITELPCWEWNQKQDNITGSMNVNVGKYVIFATTDPKGKNPTALTNLAGTKVAWHVEICDDTTIMAKLKEYYDWFIISDTSKIENIMVITQMPAELTRSGGIVKHDFTTSFKEAIDNRCDFVIRNGKTYQFPYCYYTAKSTSGEQLLIKRQEFFEDTINHRYEGTGGPEGGYRYLPIYISQISSESMDKYKYQYKYLSLPKFPQLGVSSDTFGRWLSQNGIGTAVQGLASIASIVVGVAGIVGAPFTGGMSLGASVAALGAGGAGLGSAINNTVGAIQAPDNAVGHTAGSQSAVFDNDFGMYHVSFYINMPTSKDLQGVDNFFTMYGYTINSLSVPNLRVRNKWTYVKTQNAQVTGKCPREAIEYTQNLLNNGCTFWNCKTSEIGVYTDENPDFS